MLRQAGAAWGRKEHRLFPEGCSSSGMNPCGEPAPLLLWRVCTHQEAGGIIQEAAKAAHKAPLQEGGVLWGQLIRLADDSRRAKTLSRCGREGLREDQARIHPSEGWRSPALGTAAVCRAQPQKLGESHNIGMKPWPEPRGCTWWQGAGLPASLGSWPACLYLLEKAHPRERVLGRGPSGGCA